MLSPHPPTYPKICHSLRLSTPDSCSLFQDKSVSAVTSSALCPLPPVFSHSVAIRPAFSVSSNHPDPEALRIGRVLLSLPILAHTASSACLINSSRFPFRLYERSLAFMDSSCLSIRLSPLYLHICHRLPPSIRREVYQVPSPIPSLVPLAITKS